MLNLNVFNLVFLSVLVSEIRYSDAQCSQDPNGVFRFGTNCSYMCHCLNASEQCNVSTGECSSGCDWKWGGPGCQYRNILGIDKSNQHLDNIAKWWSYYANDQNLSTCSETATSRPESEGSPWWRVWFPQNETFRELSIVTRSDKLGQFRSFQVKVEYIPTSKIGERYYYPPNTQICYTHPDSPPTSTNISVVCDRPLVGNQVRIQLNSIDTQLVLCEVKVFAGRNLAFSQTVSTSSLEQVSSTQLAVDGSVVDTRLEHCTITAWESQPWLQINLGYVANVRWIHLEKLNDDRLRNYQMQASNATGNGWQMVHDDNNTDPPTVDIRQSVTAEYFRFQKANSNKDRLALCELEIYGDCLDNVCGLNCNQVCHCANPTIEDKLSGNCSSGCKGRWTGVGGNCNKECELDKWGENCQHACGNCYSVEPCDVADGSCPSGCIPGYQPPICEYECADGRYGRNCTFNCSSNCLADKVCRKSDGHCPNGCKPGYTGETCFDKCPSGWYGDGCNEECSANCIYGSQICHHVTGQCSYGCKDGWKGVYCNQECDVGTWGSNCSKKCGNCVEGNICKNTDGFCEKGCAAGFQKTDLCSEECPEGQFGIECVSNCSNNCKDVCNKVDGTCSVCRSGWKGSNCTMECEDGEWGQGCNQTCGKCAGGVPCNRTSGTCSGGCMPGYQNTTMCDENCTQGTYGTNCEEKCSESCDPPKICNAVNGFCDRCLPGWEGSSCTKECDDGLYGAHCNSTCGGCANNTCDKINGFCNNGCKPGYIVSEQCNKECEGKTYGNNCSLTCGNCKGGTPCDTQTGNCPNECDNGFTGETCAQRIEMPPGSSPDFPVPTVAGVVAGCLVVVAIVFVVLFVRRRRLARKDTENQKYFDNVINEEVETSGKEFDNKTYVDTSKMYVNASEVTASVPPSRASERVSSAGRASSLSQSKHQESSEDTGDLYYNAGPVTKQTSDTAISIANFGEYVKGGIKYQEFFEKEFQKIPYGLVHPTKMARKSGNAGKNRYKEMYAYDHSRVVLQTLPGDPDSDYINASYIKGHRKDKAYIAAQGPMPANVTEFWRMIWENDVRIIAMVTNMVEETKTKCIKYWEAVESTAEYGSVQIFTEKEDVFAEYTIRHFKVFHKDKPGKVQKVQHFQYTAWPDKGIPSSTSSLLHFWRKVRKADEEKSHPWLVHCSAGVGRTGTFIALDILYDQGNDLGYLDVFQCVKDLRDQRVNMVQTKEQYMYLHKILVEMFVLPSEPVGVEEFPAVYKDLQELDQNKKKTKLLLAYESLHDETCDVVLSSPEDNIYSCAKQAENKDKNRYDNIFAPNEYRPILSTYVEGCTNYINAVFVPSYCDANGYILTQTPMPHTAVDLCRLIYEQEVEVIVSFDDHTNEEIGVVFPDKGSVSVGPFAISHITTERQAVYTRRAYSLSYQNKKRTVYQLVFNHWPKESVVPEDPYKMLTFLQDLDKLERQHDSKPIIIQCLNGAERSGLVVILRNILERAVFDEEISIPQVIRQMRLRRQQIIPNFEQFRFCYEVFLCYSESSATYANM